MNAPLVIGHRGASGYRPEHSESAYRLACELGADFVEPDIVATCDGVLVVRHENEISGTTDVAAHPEFASRRTTKTVDGVKLTGWFTEDFTWAELSTLRCIERLAGLRPENTRFDGAEPILRLSDALRILDEESVRRDREIGVVIEIKHAQFFLERGFDLGELVLAEVEASGWAGRHDRIIFESFELGVLDRLRAAEAPGKLVFLTERVGLPADEPVGRAPARSYAWYRSDAGLDVLSARADSHTRRVDGISVAKGSLIALNALGLAVGPTDLAHRAHERGLLIFTWTLRPENRFLSLKHQRGLRPSDFGDWQAEFALILAAGVDGIFVDHPDLGRRAVAAAAAPGDA